MRFHGCRSLDRDRLSSAGGVPIACDGRCTRGAKPCWRARLLLMPRLPPHCGQVVRKTTTRDLRRSTRQRYSVFTLNERAEHDGNGGKAAREEGGGAAFFASAASGRSRSGRGGARELLGRGGGWKRRGASEVDANAAAHARSASLRASGRSARRSVTDAREELKRLLPHCGQVVRKTTTRDLRRSTRQRYSDFRAEHWSESGRSGGRIAARCAVARRARTAVAGAATVQRGRITSDSGESAGGYGWWRDWSQRFDC